METQEEAVDDDDDLDDDDLDDDDLTCGAPLCLQYKTVWDTQERLEKHK